MATFGNAFVVIGNSWTAFKVLVASKDLRLQYDEDTETYEVFAIDNPIAYVCTIWKTTVPYAVVAGGYSQAQNDADKTDFESNYQGDANKRLTSSIEVTFQESTLVDGYTTTSSTNFAAIYGTTYNEQTTNGQRSFVSSNANDTSAGTGARTVLVTYYDQDLAGPYTETVTLNGTSAVNTVANDICFIESMEVLTVGSQLGNLGAITMYDSTDGGGSVVGSIAVGDNETNWVHHYIGASKFIRLTSIYAHIKGLSGGGAHLRKATPTIANTPEKTITPILRTPPGQQVNLEIPIPITIVGPARITLYAKPDMAESIDWLAGFNYFEDGV